MSLTFNTHYETAFADITINKPDADTNIEYGQYNAIEQHIKRGSSIRKKKPQDYPRVREYNPIRDINKLKCEKKKSFSRYRTRCPNGNNFYSGFGASNVHTQMKSTISSAKRLNKRLKRTHNKYRNCPMRIAELATPNKRRCLETWKEKCKVLPDIIVERFKKYIMDQKPVVQIPEAIYCFKKSKTSKTDSSGKKKKRKNIKKCSQTMEIKTLSIIFGYKIAQRLNKPILVKLNLRFTTLSGVVGDDIASLMHTRTCSSNNRLSLITEMANKITLWIALILEDSSLKLLEDTLEDLEDEEGPVFDCIDVLLENVLDICEPHFVYSDRYNSKSNSLSQSQSKSDSSSQSESFDENSSAKELHEIINVNNLEHEESEQDTNRHKQETEEETINSTENYITNQLNDVISFSIARSEGQHKNEHLLFNDNLNTSKSQTLQNECTRKKELANVIDSAIADPKAIGSTLKQEETEEQSNKNIDILEAQDEEETKEIEHEMQRADSVIANEDLNLIVDPLENDNFVVKNNSKIMLPGENVANTEFSQDIVETIDTEEKNNPDSEEIDYDIPEDIILNRYNTEEKKSDENNEYNIQDVIQKTEDNERNEKDDSQVPKDLYLSELYEVSSEEKRTEEITDDKNKKVKFSSTEMVTQGTLQSKRRDTDLSENNFNYDQEQILSQPSIDIIKSTISFSGPNEELLSDADELWPKDISSPIMRPSESVSRSITSLGRIMESDEKVLISPDSVTDTILEDSFELLAQSHSEEITNASESVENNNNTLKEISNGSEIVEKNNNTLKEITKGSEFVEKNNNTIKEISNGSEFVEKNNNTLKENSTQSDTILNEVVVIPQITSVDIPSPHGDKHKIENKESNNKKETREKLKEKVKAKTNQNKTDRIPYNKKFHKSYKSPAPNVVAKTKPMQKAAVANTYKSGTTKEILQQSTNKNSRKNNMKQISVLNAVQIDTKLSMQVHSEKGITKENISTYYEHSKPDYKVKLSSAPKWINRNNKRGCSKKNSIADYYARKWCDDLYNGFEHLEIWRDWIIIICELILTRKRCRPNKVSINNTIRHLNEWINLKRNIDSEAYLWRRLNRHTKKKLRHIIYVCKKESELGIQSDHNVLPKYKTQQTISCKTHQHQQIKLLLRMERICIYKCVHHDLSNLTVFHLKSNCFLTCVLHAIVLFC